MKKIFITILAAATVLSSCNRTLIEDAGHGTFSVDLSTSDECNAITKADANEDVNSFKVEIVRKTDGVKTHSYDRFADMPQILDMISGEYTFIVSSPAMLPAAFNQPIYGASHDFVVKVGEATSEKIVCTLQNVKLTFSLSEAFQREISTYTISVSNGSGAAHKLYWTNVATETEGVNLTKDITKAGYFAAEPLTIHVDGKRTADGSEASHEIMITDPSARDHFIVSLDAKVTGSAGFGIEIDPSVNVRDDEEVFVPGFDEDPVEDPVEDPEGGNDDPEDNTGSGDNTGSDDNTGDSGNTSDSDMTMVWAGHESANNVYPSVDIDVENPVEVNLQIEVPGKIAGFVVQIDSESEEFMDVIPEMTSDGGNRLDLINDEVAIEAMSDPAIQLITEDLAGKTSVSFNLTGLIPMITFVADSGTNHVFTLEVTDETGYSETWKLTFRIP